MLLLFFQLTRINGRFGQNLWMKFVSLYREGLSSIRQGGPITDYKSFYVK